MRVLVLSVLAMSLVMMLTTGAPGAIPIPGADGSDGAFNPAANVAVDLSQAVSAQWDTASPEPGKGVYDAEKWAVVFKYSTVNIPAGVTVTFKNHPSRPPVVWLVSGDVTIAGTISVNGQDATRLPFVFAEGGPGGFRGGSSLTPGRFGSAGFGPGGGEATNNTPFEGHYSYGNIQVIPLIGGSGGGSGHADGCIGGSGGGGAILIACAGHVMLAGSIAANAGAAYGSYPSGSGGAIRLVGDSITGNGTLAALGWREHGRIRVEANSIALTSPGSPECTSSLPGPIWPDADFPSVRVIQVEDQAVPAQPATLDWPKQDVTVATTSPVTVLVEARNVPTTWKVNVRAVPYSGTSINALATCQSGDQTLSRWAATLTLPANQTSVIQARAYKP